MGICKGENCMAVDGVNHSQECIKNHDAIYDKINGVPTCFDRAESGGRKFDNCRYYNDCKQVKPICTDNPLKNK